MSDEEDKWIPDSESTGCSLCHREFTVTFRRHHCRSCGKVVCSDCSPHRVEFKPCIKERVCDACEVRFTEDGTGVSENLKVKYQMAMSLKSALKDKQSEIDRYKSLIASLIDGQTGSVDPQSLHGRVGIVVHEKVEEYLKVESELNRERLSLNTAEKQARDLARKTLNAEAEVRRNASILSEIQELEDKCRKQDIIIDKLRDRVQRMETSSTRPPSSSASNLIRSDDPRVSLLVEGQRDSLGRTVTYNCSRQCKEWCNSFCTIS